MFTCCKNTFPNFNITHSHFQAFIHSFLVRWLDVSAKRKQKWKSKGKSSDLCTNGSKGRAVSKNKKEKKKMQEAVLHCQGGKLGMRDKRQRATAGGYVCILNPEREKVTSSHHNFLLLLFANRPHQSPLCPPPTSHPCGSGSETFKSSRAVMVTVAGQSHTQEWNISYEHTHTVLIC